MKGILPENKNSTKAFWNRLLCLPLQMERKDAALPAHQLPSHRWLRSRRGGGAHGPVTEGPTAGAGGAAKCLRPPVPPTPGAPVGSGHAHPDQPRRGGAQAMPKQMPARIPSRRPPASRRHPAGRRRGERSTVRGQEPRRGPVSGGGRLGLASPEERGGGAGAALELEALQVDVGPVSEQRLHRLGVPAPGGQVQCAEPLLVRQVTHVGAD